MAAALAPVAPDVRLQQLHGRGRHQVGERVDERPVRGAHVFLAPSHRDRGAGVVPAMDGMADDGGLAHARLAADEHHPPPAALAHCLERFVQRAELVGPADEGGGIGGEAGGQRRGRGLRPLPPDLDDLDRPGQALQLAGAGVVEPVGARAAAQRLDEGRREDLVAVGLRGQPRGLHHRLAVAVAVLVADVADGQADPDGQRRRRAPLVEAVDRLLGGAGRGHPVAHGQERRHEAVAGALHDGAVVGVHNRAERGVVGAAGVVEGVAVGDRQLGRPHEVREEHRRRSSCHASPPRVRPRECTAGPMLRSRAAAPGRACARARRRATTACPWRRGGS